MFDVTYVVDRFDNVGMVASVLGYDEHTAYACCGEVAMVNGDPVLEQLLDNPRIVGDMHQLLPERQAAQFEGFEELKLYWVDIPDKENTRFVIKPFKANTARNLVPGRDFVFLTTDVMAGLGFSYMLERYKIGYDNAYIVLLDHFTPDEILQAKDTGNWLCFGDVLLAWLKEKELTGWSEKRHDRDETIDLKEVQKCLNMTNSQFAYYFGFKLRTVENWRANPQSVPGHVWKYLRFVCFYQHQALQELYDSDAISAYEIIGKGNY